MSKRMQSVILSGLLVFVAAFGVASVLAQDEAAAPAQASPYTYVERYHGAVGSWFGIATQVCPTGIAPVACAGGSPAVTLYMTPTLLADGNFVGNDTLTLAGPPFGPHTVAHGKWVPTSATEFVADYVFMAGAYPPSEASIIGLRFRWQAQLVGNDTIVGYVNAYFVPGIPLTWSKLAADAFPAYPAEALPMVTPPATFYKDPGTCQQGAACPLVFKFTIKRVAP